MPGDSQIKNQERARKVVDDLLRKRNVRRDVEKAIERSKRQGRWIR